MPRIRVAAAVALTAVLIAPAAPVAQADQMQADQMQADQMQADQMQADQMQADQSHPVTASRQAAHKQADADKNWNPKTGLKLNDPLKNGKRFPGFDQILRSVRNTKYPAQIAIATWNLDSGRLVDSLLAAHRRGVRVRLLMQGNMAREQGPGKSYDRLQQGLQQPRTNPAREDVGASWANICENSCRGHAGILHSKFYLFSQVSKTPWVIINSSGNATEFSATVQWNDTYTVVGEEGLYGHFLKIFEEMKKDKPAHPRYKTWKENGRLTSYFYPYRTRKAKAEPVLENLKGVRCTGAAPGTGDGAGHTRIRIAQTAWMSWRGVQIAKRIRALKSQGCDIKVIYAVMDPGVAGTLTGVPKREITQDITGDGVYDRYLHLKVLTISGAYGNQNNTNVVWNGSENWVGYSLDSDEASLRIESGPLVAKYNAWIARLFSHPPKNHARIATRTFGPVDAYANVEIN